MQLALNDTVDVIGATAEREDIDCHFAKGGYLSVARNQAQWTRGQAEVANARDWGFDEDFLQLLDANDVAERIGISNALGGTFTPHCAAIQPQLLNRGLADAVERRGGTHLRTHPRDVRRTRHRADAARRGACRGGGARHRGLHHRPAGARS